MSTEALSPLMARSDEGDAILVEDTGELWGDTQWSAGYLWADELPFQTHHFLEISDEATHACRPYYHLVLFPRLRGRRPKQS